ncbi:hypothetical protein [Nocardioides sp. KR10-350]|uniref:hypothetical protein n=1 Tax=Nocardioides cheoyonin TaxID=3156615 RepID=UPI0032B439D9
MPYNHRPPAGIPVTDTGRADVSYMRGFLDEQRRSWTWSGVRMGLVIAAAEFVGWMLMAAAGAHPPRFVGTLAVITPVLIAVAIVVTGLRWCDRHRYAEFLRTGR